MPNTQPELTPVMIAVMNLLAVRGLTSSMEIHADNEQASVEDFLIATGDRHVWLGIRAELADMIQSLGAVFVEQRLWDDDHELLYMFRVMPGSMGKHPWEPLTICRSKDARADRCMYRYLEELGMGAFNAGYGWTETGVHFTVLGRDEAQKLRGMFSDCEAFLTRDGMPGYWKLAVAFPE